MRVTVIVPDHLIGIDDVFRHVDMDWPEHLWALQWHDQDGHMEWTHQPNTPAQDHDLLPYITAWHNAAPIDPLTDPSDEQAQNRNYALTYLEQTDWYIIRQAETSQQVPETVLTQRQQARDTLNETPQETPNHE